MSTPTTSKKPNVRYADPNAPMRILVHGEPGTGRKTFCAQAPNPVFLCLDRNGPPRGVPCWEIVHNDGDAIRYPDVVAALSRVVDESHEYKTVVVQSMDAIQALIIKEIEEETGQTFSAYNDENRGGGYELIAEHWETFYNYLDVVQRKRNVHVVLIADSRYNAAFGVDSGPTEKRSPFSRATIDTGGQKATGLAKRWAEYMLFLDVKPVTTSSFDETGHKQQTEYVRFINCTQLPEVDAHCAGAVPWPDFIEFHVDHGFDWFLRNAMLIRKYGKELPSRLKALLKETLTKVPPADVQALGEAFTNALEQHDYAGAKQMLEFATSVAGIGGGT